VIRARAIIACAAIAMATGLNAAEPILTDDIAAAIAGGRLAQARAMIARADPGAPDIAAALPLLTAELALAERHDDVAYSAFAALRRQTPCNCRADEGFAIAALRLNRMEGVREALETATRQCPDRWKAWNALGIVNDRLARWAESDEAYRQALAASPDRAKILNNLGYSMILRKRPAEAIAPLREATRLAPRNLRAANNLDIARSAAGEDMIAQIPDRGSERWADRVNNAGYAAFLAGDKDHATRYLSAAISAADVYPARAAANLALVQAVP
jgi:Flp pilus assembly protein TadD